MKRFIKQSLFFLVLAILFVESICLFLVKTNLYLNNYPGSEIMEAIFKSKRKSSSRNLLLGDSVGRQLFSWKVENDTLNSLACNRAIGVVGHYLLLDNYLKINEVDTVYLLYRPFSFQNNLDEVYTYHYFLKPFYRSEYTALFTPTAQKQIQKIPFHQYCSIPHIMATSWAPDFTATDEINFTFLSPISAEYLNKIKALTQKHQCKLVILPTPVPIADKELIESMDKNEIIKHNLEAEFKDYFDKIMYLDNALFSDGEHLIDAQLFLERYKREVMYY